MSSRPLKTHHIGTLGKFKEKRDEMKNLENASLDKHIAIEDELAKINEEIQKLISRRKELEISMEAVEREILDRQEDISKINAEISKIENIPVRDPAEERSLQELKDLLERERDDLKNFE